MVEKRVDNLSALDCALDKPGLSDACPAWCLVGRLTSLKRSSWILHWTSKIPPSIRSSQMKVNSVSAWACWVEDVGLPILNSHIVRNVYKRIESIRRVTVKVFWVGSTKPQSPRGFCAQNTKITRCGCAKKLENCDVEGRARLFSTELELSTVMSDSAATRRQLKIKAGVVKRFVTPHILSIIQEINRFDPSSSPSNNNAQIPERTSALPRRSYGKPTETPIFQYG